MTDDKKLPYHPANYANAAEFGATIIIRAAGRELPFAVGDRTWYKHNGWCWTSGEIQTADGQRYWAVIEICEQDSGEHWGTVVPHRGTLRTQDEGFVGFLARRKSDIFPYGYRYDAPIENDWHVGHDGWNRP